MHAKLAVLLQMCVVKSSQQLCKTRDLQTLAPFRLRSVRFPAPGPLSFLPAGVLPAARGGRAGPCRLFSFSVSLVELFIRCPDGFSGIGHHFLAAAVASCHFHLRPLPPTMGIVDLVTYILDLPTCVKVLLPLPLMLVTFIAAHSQDSTVSRMGAIFWSQVHLAVTCRQQPSVQLCQVVYDCTTGKPAASHPSISSKAFNKTSPTISTASLVRWR